MTKSNKDMPSPILLYGDSTLSQNIILRAKKKYSDAHWVTLPAKEDVDTDAIRSEIGSTNWDDSDKVLVINNLANRKNMREFLLDLAQGDAMGDFETKLIIWDSTNVIKVDPKTNVVSTATWKKFVKGFEDLGIGKVVNSGAEFTLKETSSCVKYVEDGFKKKGRDIDHDAAKLFVKLVGFDRGMLNSEIEKLSWASSQDQYISYKFVLDNAFASSKEAVLYVLSNALDTESEGDCIYLIEEFMANGVNENVISEILVNKARWQLIVADLFHKGFDWDVIANKIMKMGKFPSESGKKCETLHEAIDYLCTERGIPKRYFRQILKKSDSKAKMKRGAALPMPFMAHDVVRFTRTQILGYHDGLSKTEAQKLILSRGFKVYGSLQDRLLNVRMQKSVKHNLYAMVRELKDPYFQ